MVVLSLCDLLVSLMSKFYVLVKEEMEWTVIPFLRVFFFLSSLFKKAFIQLAENWLILSNPNVHSCFELILQKRQQTPGVFCIASPDGFDEAQRLHPWNLTAGIYPSSNNRGFSGNWGAWKMTGLSPKGAGKGKTDHHSKLTSGNSSNLQASNLPPWLFRIFSRGKAIYLPLPRLRKLRGKTCSFNASIWSVRPLMVPVTLKVRHRSTIDRGGQRGGKVKILTYQLREP